MCLELLSVSHSFHIYDMRFTCASHALSRAVPKSFVMQVPARGWATFHVYDRMNGTALCDAEEHCDDDWGRYAEVEDRRERSQGHVPGLLRVHCREWL